MNSFLHEIIVGFQYARPDFLDGHPQLRDNLERAFGALYLTEAVQVETVIDSKVLPIKALSNLALLANLESFLAMEGGSMEGKLDFLRMEDKLDVIDPDGSIQSTLLEQIQQQFSSIELTKIISIVYSQDCKLLR